MSRFLPRMKRKKRLTRGSVQMQWARDDARWWWGLRETPASYTMRYEVIVYFAGHRIGSDFAFTRWGAGILAHRIRRRYVRRFGNPADDNYQVKDLKFYSDEE